MSISDQWGTSAPVSTSSRIVGEDGLSDSSMLSGRGRPCAVAPGRCVTMLMPGENPSRVLNGVTSVTPPELLTGTVMGSNCVRSPVSRAGSATVNTLLGSGKAQ